jgi:hypothetical protein
MNVQYSFMSLSHCNRCCNDRIIYIFYEWLKYHSTSLTIHVSTSYMYLFVCAYYFFTYHIHDWPWVYMVYEPPAQNWQQGRIFVLRKSIPSLKSTNRIHFSKEFISKRKHCLHRRPALCLMHDGIVLIKFYQNKWVILGQELTERNLRN